MLDVQAWAQLDVPSARINGGTLSTIVNAPDSVRFNAQSNGVPDAVEVGRSVPKLPESLRLGETVGACIGAGQEEPDAQGIMKANISRGASGTMVKPTSICADVYSFSSAMSACARLDRTAPTALHLLDIMSLRDVQPNGYAYAAAIRACRQLADAPRALALLQQMREANLRPTAVEYTGAISACAVSAEWEEAVRLLIAMEREGLSPDEAAFTAAIGACGRARAWKAALAVHAQLRAAVARQAAKAGARKRRGNRKRTTGKPLEVSVRTYAATLNALDRAARWDEALKILSEMRRDGVTPDLMCFTALLSLCAEARDHAAAARLWKEMLELGVRPDAVCAASMLDVCIRCRQPTEGLAIVRQIWERFEERKPGRMYTRAEAEQMRLQRQREREEAEARGEVYVPPPPPPSPLPPPQPVFVPPFMLKGEIPTHKQSELLTPRQRMEVVRCGVP